MIKEINDIYEGCLLGKQHQQPFSFRKSWGAKEPLELVNKDVCGLMQHEKDPNQNLNHSKGIDLS